MSQKYLKKLLLVLSVIFIIYLVYFLQDIRYCDTYENMKLVTTPNGQQIPYYQDSPDAKSFGKLAGPCKYNSNDKIDCPDVRLKGESMNRQGLLVIARMHAIFDLICKKRGIKYWIYSGALIGAQRNGLMIPWDYDSDIGIMMDDFQKLLKFIRQDLPNDIFFETGVDTPNMKKFCEARLRDKNSCYGHCLRAGCDRHDGIQIDIFAYRPLIKGQNKIKNHYYSPILQLDEIFPLSIILLEGIPLPGPKNSSAVTARLYGKNFLRLPDKKRYQCQKNGYTAIPWYSCEQLKAMPYEQRLNVLKSSMGHRNLFYWYFG